MTLTTERLRELLTYDPVTGIFTWRVARGRGIRAGDLAGNTDTAGYLQIRIDGRRYSAHRCAHLYMTGAWPKDQIDHADCDRKNNKWSNLRETDRSGNGANRGALRSNTSGFKGVSWDKKTGKWRAYIMARGAWISLGYFDEKRDAHHAYEIAARQFFGEFARAA